MIPLMLLSGCHYFSLLKYLCLQYLQLHPFLSLFSIFFAVPPQNVRVSGPQKIKPGHGQKVKFSCKSDVGNPAAELTYKVFEMTSGPFQNDILHQLVTDGVVELQESKERFVNRQQDMTENNNSGGNTGWVTSREILIHPRIVRKIRGNQLRIQCLSNENIADELVVELISTSRVCRWN
jgi:hypothetical protein